MKLLSKLFELLTILFHDVFDNTTKPTEVKRLLTFDTILFFIFLVSCRILRT